MGTGCCLQPDQLVSVPIRPGACTGAIVRSEQGGRVVFSIYHIAPDELADVLESLAQEAAQRPTEEVVRLFGEAFEGTAAALWERSVPRSAEELRRLARHFRSKPIR